MLLSTVPYLLPYTWHAYLNYHSQTLVGDFYTKNSSVAEAD